jgi:hypothetical protein
MDAGSIFFFGLLLIIFIWPFLFPKKHTASTQYQPWSTRYEPRPEQYGVPSTTLTGIPVKSHTERFIADYFTKNNIRYEYEPVLRGGRRGNKTMHPDFYLPDYDIYVEYWGLVDIPDEYKREDYIKTMKWKMAQYHSRDIKFISIYPNNMNNFEYAFPRKFEELTGSKLVNYPSNLNASNFPYTSMITCRHCNGIIRKGEPFCSYCGKENP